MKTSSRRSSTPNRRPHVDRLPVHSQVTIEADGQRAVEHRVYCDVRESTVALPVCAGCARAREVPLRPGDPGAYVACATGRPELSAMLDVTARAHALPLAQFMRRSSVSVTADASLETVERVVLDGDNDAVVVVDEERAPIGIITKTDLLWRLYDECDTSEPQPPALPERGMHLTPPTVTASDIMTPFVHALPDDATLSIGIGLLAMGEIDQVPVVSRSNEVVGVFSNSDVVRWLASELGVFPSAPSAARR